MTAPGRNLRRGQNAMAKGFVRAAAGRAAARPLGGTACPRRRSGGVLLLMSCHAQLRNIVPLPFYRVLKLRCPRSAGVLCVAGNVRRVCPRLRCGGPGSFTRRRQIRRAGAASWLRANVSTRATGA